MSIVFIALGSNLGDRLANLKNARQALAEHPRITVMDSSQIYETEPYGNVDQDDFLNAAVKIETDLSPQELLACIQQIEADLGRKRLIHWGPRTIDLDILLFDNLQIQAENLTIPHAELTKRSFVLVPLKDIYNQKIFGKDLVEWINISGNAEEVRGSDLEW
ncbi:2-amino-4-hydroxy-6-hydroxymethyldihydropteridine diphosphokinase [Enterococcus sp. BWT-B8]|uniref:2-amino-4-hydroxy-6- hydroxymethyldihydropteridine diphosphokinase n=1 Tax=Enterococcus sp. BWT-B8 TaxID=2885157 RepID=UPI001E3E3A36|nr:2-amino-4-hydroxy-6-hydroxymethyldihydropteridine diphosphokinase [Enterococcus sp. BWT-B8]MCB5951454.1 2-amino-4-hydroxy-6-hydroxymethyldihydropteridine diphosphokinase [Enterococcus sp. BWT-B8]